MKAKLDASAKEQAREGEHKGQELEVKMREDAEVQRGPVLNARVETELAEAVKAGEDAEASAAKKAAEEAAWRRRVEEEARVKAEKAAEARIAVAVAAAVAKTKAQMTAASKRTTELEDDEQN